jgi:hypothetical protein
LTMACTVAFENLFQNFSRMLLALRVTVNTEVHPNIFSVAHTIATPRGNTSDRKSQM